MANTRSNFLTYVQWTLDNIELFTPEIVTQMREWCDECDWAEDEIDFYDEKEYADIDILRGVNKHYEGGCQAFLLSIS